MKECNKDCITSKEYEVAQDMWSRGFRSIKNDLSEYGNELLKSKGIDLEVAQKILDENYDIWTENMEWYFKEGHNFSM